MSEDILNIQNEFSASPDTGKACYVIKCRYWRELQNIGAVA